MGALQLDWLFCRSRQMITRDYPPPPLQETAAELRLLRNCSARKRLGFTLVTILSSSRLILGGMFVLLFLDPSKDLRRLSLWIFIVMCLSDLVDGPLARRWKVV